jgi:hypothetical protein
MDIAAARDVEVPTARHQRQAVAARARREDLVPVPRRRVDLLPPVDRIPQRLAQVVHLDDVAGRQLVQADEVAGIGVFGVVSWSARQRVTEFGIRLAVGAGPSDILRLVLRQALVLVGVGLGIGVLAAIPAMRLLASQLYGIRASDPVAFIGVAVLLALTGLLAGLVPALRTTRMDPLEALREG